jgi:superfamily II DNA/RNA helicase
MSFDTLGLGDAVLAAVKEAGYTEPTEIQRDAIPVVLAGKDLLGIAQTGTGKTASFTLPMIEILSKGRARARMPRSLILEPTRELAAQVADNFDTYGKNTKLTMALLIGGVSFQEQDRKLDRGVDVLIATPGRLMDHMERGKVMLNGVQILVVDEADRMLDMGFIPDIEKICKRVPFTRQTLFFSATMPPEISRLTEEFQQAPVKIEVERKSMAADTIAQSVVYVSSRDYHKRDALRRIIESESDLTNAIVFCNRKRDVDIVAKSMATHGYKASPLHGDLNQRIRMETLNKFKAGEVEFLIASDVAARGLDIPAVSHVFNFDVPTVSEDYVHRIGRTGRAGRTGTAITIATKSERKYVEAIEKLVNQSIKVATVEGVETDDSARDEGRERKKQAGNKRGGQRGDQGGGRRDSNRGGRNRSRGGKPQESGSAKSAQGSPASEKPEQSAKTATSEKSDNQDRKPRENRKPREPRKSGSSGNGGGNGGGNKSGQNQGTKGMGEHMPAFLQNTTRPASDD